MNKTVKWVLLSLNLLPYTHIAIRRHGKDGVEYLGGGCFTSVIKRFGNEIIDSSSIVDDILCIYVK